MDWFNSSVLSLEYYFLCKQKTFYFILMRDSKGNFHVKTSGLSPSAILHLVPFKLLVSSDADIISEESDFIRAVRDEGLFFAEF